MSFDVTTLALAKSYADQHGSGGGSVGDITAEDVSYPNSFGEGSPENVGQALDVLITGFNATRKDVLRLNKSEHTHSNKDTLDKLSDSNGKLQYNGSDVGLKPVYYIDLAGEYPNYTCPVAMDDIKAAYNSGYNLVCRCTLGKYTATLPLFAPMPAANTWIFSGSGALKSMGFAAQSFTVAIAANGVVAQNVALSQPLHITVGNLSLIHI